MEGIVKLDQIWAGALLQDMSLSHGLDQQILLYELALLQNLHGINPSGITFFDQVYLSKGASSNDLDILKIAHIDFFAIVQNVVGHAVLQDVALVRVGPIHSCVVVPGIARYVQI